MKVKSPQIIKIGDLVDPKYHHVGTAEITNFLYLRTESKRAWIKLNNHEFVRNQFLSILGKETTYPNVKEQGHLPICLEIFGDSMAGRISNSILQMTVIKKF